ncbi:glycosyltransferase family 2 protein [Fulvivirga sp. 29W222]|uniref:Glycosyltransferase family 2 protein n=1 Tax=Fulvivirga marina TaxID=2494733 RepID=A0A937FZZ4_9BACT|nr:glycosyltransferase family 2 protein [Fulvivirga marina]MBL6448117.1 glycosyltransferase family 2 protein [Fulvivirga marina]
MVSIVIPVHNRKKFTRNCLLSLERQTVHEHNIIVVDDGSTDGTEEMLEQEFPEVTIIKGNGNLFWTAAVNLGIRHALDAGAEYVMTMNNDTIAAVDFMEKMLYWSAKEPYALLGALEIDFDTLKPYYGGEITHKIWNTSRYLLEELDEKDWKGLHEVSLFPGRGLLVPRAIFDVIGLFEEKKLPHYMADYDFTVMARRNSFKVYCNYDAHLFTYPEEGGDHKIRNKKSLKNYYNHLFTIKGGGNLRNFTIYTLRNSPAGLVPMHLLKGYIQRIFGYLIH